DRRVLVLPALGFRSSDARRPVLLGRRALGALAPFGRLARGADRATQHHGLHASALADPARPGAARAGLLARSRPVPSADERLADGCPDTAVVHVGGRLS